ncbi:MAG: HAD hydrolase-like protein [Cryobacterium sp.]|nr:HAD hydrolase-like protein [Cryobacterium sp.]
MKPWSCVLFDLDGTIADSAPGITASLAHMFEALGRPVPTPEELRAWVGPPILDSFRDAGMNHTESQQALAIYREHYLTSGNGHSPIFPDIPLVLRRLHEEGMPIALATSKPEFPASVILDHGNLTQYFRVISGSSIDEVKSTKQAVVTEALDRFRILGVDLSNPIMIGDRFYDIEGAAANGVPTIFVRWGYGSPTEEVGALNVVSEPTELLPLLLP